MTMRFTFKKEERLCSKTELDRLFTQGKSVFVYPFKFIFNRVDAEQEYPVRVVFSVPKRSFKKAVTRNLIRRRMREAYRLHKANIYPKMNQNISLMILYVDKEILEYSKIKKGMEKGFNKLQNKLNNYLEK